MTNEEKAKELFPDMPAMAPIVSKSIREKILEMAEWKDSQFKAFMTTKIHNLNYFCDHYVGPNREEAIKIAKNKIDFIYELFAELYL